MLPIQGRPRELHLLLLRQTVTRARGQPGFAQHPRCRRSQRAQRALAEPRSQCLICPFERERAGGQERGTLWSNDGVFQRLLFYSAAVEVPLCHWLGRIFSPVELG